MISFHPFGGPDTEVRWDNMPVRVLHKRGNRGRVLGKGSSDSWTESKALLRLRREGFLCVCGTGRSLVWLEGDVGGRSGKDSRGWLTRHRLHG